MRAATVVQQLCKSCRTCFKFHCMFYLSPAADATGRDGRTMAWAPGVTTTRSGVPWTSAFNESSTASESHDPGLPDEHQYVLIALYTTTAVLAVTGNVVVIVVLAVGRRSRTDLRAFLINLAVADLTMAIFCMPFTFTATMQHDWIFGAAMCTIVLFLQVSPCFHLHTTVLCCTPRRIEL